MKTGIRMHQRTTSLAARVLLALAGAFGGFAPAPTTAQGINYVTSSTTRLTSGAWIVKDEVTVLQRISVDSSARVQLSFMTSATLNAKMGIEVPSGATLTIKGAGTLNATGSDGGAGIGGGNRNSGVGTIIINGGTIKATGSVAFGSDGSVSYSSGIGGGGMGSGGSVTINGGQVTATGGLGSAGIGGEGMTVTLGWTAASDFIDTTGFQGTVGFAGGKRFSYAGTPEEATSENLRGGRLLPIPDNSRKITVVDAENGSVTPDKFWVVSGDTVTLTANSSYPYALYNLTVVTAADASVDVERIDRTTYRFEMPDEDVTATPVFAVLLEIAVEGAENGSVTPDKFLVVPGETVTLTANSSYPWVLDSLTAVTATGASVDVEQIDRTTCRFEMPDENVTVTPIFAEVTPVELTTSEGIRTCWPVMPNLPLFDASFSEWYAVTEDATLPERLNVAGNVKLHLGAGATLTCEKGLRVAAGNGLTIEGEGAMVARSYSPTAADDDNAAIGSDEQQTCGDITIRGGTITAIGSTYAAAIGAGYIGNGGSVTITGGKVTAIGGSHSPGIGSSYNSFDANTTITLGWTEEDDSIYCSHYYGDLSFVPGKEFLREDNLHIVTGANIHGVRILPKLSDAHNITVNSTGTGELSADVSSAVKNATITLSWTTTNRYIIPTTLTVKDGQGQDIAVEWTSLTSASFVMPDEAVTVTAVFGDVGYVAVTTSDGTVRNCRPITPHLSFGDYGAGNYAVTEDTTIGDRVVIGDDVLLYLCDGKTLTCGSGITVDGGNSLTVDGGGSLIADARGYDYGNAAGIGGANHYGTVGTITINGGSVTAYGGEVAAGIGGGNHGSAGTVTINGGTVHATGGSSGAGIGGGSYSTVGMIAINGGQVTAIGGQFGSGIGGGYNSTGGTIILNGGQIIATGGESAAGIGCGFYGSGVRVTLNWTSTNDSIYASRYEADVAIVPGKYFALLDTGEVATTGNINGQTIVPFTGESYTISEDAGAYCQIGAIHTDGTDPAVKITEAPAGNRVYVQCSILDEYYYEQELTNLAVTASGGEAVDVTALGDGVFQFVMPADNVTLTPQTSEIVYYDINLVPDEWGAFSTLQRTFNDSEPHHYLYATTNFYRARAGDTVRLGVFAQCPYYTYGITVTAGNGENVDVTKHSDLEYEFEMPSDAITVTIQTAEIETVVKTTSEGEQTCLVPRAGINDWARYAQAKGVYWFTPTEDTTIPHSIFVESNLHVRLYLSEGTMLICPEIHVASGSTLTIEGEGTLIADATGEVFDGGSYDLWYRAGIGGGGNIIIKGGDITAKGRVHGAGIGGDISQGGYGTGGYSGDVTISGGSIHAIGGEGAAGIGSSFRENCGVITISGGTVDAVGGWWGAGIGGGYGANGDIRISGGDVNATGVGAGAGIGGGSNGTGGKIAISGGVVTAQGGVDYGYGAGIGEGSYALPALGTSTVIRITGGQITARGGCQAGDMIGGVVEYPHSAGIGLGWKSQVGVCDITLGWTEESDYVDSDLYYGDVTFEDDKFFKLSGTHTLATPENIDGVRIVPAVESLDLLPGEGTGNSPWLIRSEREWKILCDSILFGGETSGKYFRMTADVGPVTEMAGGAGHPFEGTFDGGGHTLTAAIESTDVWAAPFGFVNGATISNLTVTGTVTGGGNHAGGLVGACAGGPNVLRDCTVAVDVSVADGIGYAGGIVGQGGDSTLSFEGCVFSGSVSGFNAFAGGLLGWGSSMTLSIADCLCTGTFTPSDNGKFHPIACKRDNQAVAASVERAYYLNTLEPTASGNNLITEGTPVNAAYVPGEWSYPFTGPDGNVYYLAEAGTAAAPDWDGVIHSAADWDLFAATLANGTDSFDGRTVVLEADIGVTHPAGTADHPFEGTFDGGGHTLTADISDTGRGAAPFRCIDGATISNLTVCGTVTSSGFHAAGLVGTCVGTQPNTIADCVVAAGIGASYAGGIVGHGGTNGTLTLERCVFSGGISGFGNFAGGLLGWCDRLTLTLGDCLCKGTFAPAGGKYHPIGCKWGDGTVTLDIERVYYLNTLVATVTGVQLIPGADGTPVSATYVQGEWNRPVTAADGLTYYRQPSGSYDEWTAETGIAGAWNEKDADGIANVFRYAFDVTEGTDGMRILDLTFNDQGQVVVQTPPVVNSNGFGLSIATANDPAGTQNAASYPLDTDGETVIDEPDTGSRTRFYRLKAALSE